MNKMFDINRVYSSRAVDCAVCQPMVQLPEPMVQLPNPRLSSQIKPNLKYGEFRIFSNFGELVLSDYLADDLKTLTFYLLILRDTLVALCLSQPNDWIESIKFIENHFWASSILVGKSWIVNIFLFSPNIQRRGPALTKWSSADQCLIWKTIPVRISKSKETRASTNSFE